MELPLVQSATLLAGGEPETCLHQGSPSVLPALLVPPASYLLVLAMDQAMLPEAWPLVLVMPADLAQATLLVELVQPLAMQPLAKARLAAAMLVAAQAAAAWLPASEQLQLVAVLPATVQRRPAAEAAAAAVPMLPAAAGPAALGQHIGDIAASGPAAAGQGIAAQRPVVA